MPAGSGEEGEGQMQTLSEMVSNLVADLDGIGEKFTVARGEFKQEVENLSQEYAELKSELLVVRSERDDLDQKHQIELKERLKAARKCSELERKLKERLEAANTSELEKKCESIEAKLVSETQERLRAEQVCKDIEQLKQLEQLERVRIGNNYAMLCEAHRLEQMEKQRIGCLHGELEQRHEAVRLEKLNVERKYQELVEEKLGVVNKYEELERRHEMEMVGKMNVEGECRLLEEVNQEKVRIEKEHAELWEKYKQELLDKARSEIRHKELAKEHRDLVEEKNRIDKEYRELDEKYHYQLEIMDMSGIEEEKISEMEEKHKLEIQDMSVACNELEGKLEVELKAKLKVVMLCEELEEKYSFEQLEKLKVQRECKEHEEKHELELVERHKAQEEFKELEKKHQGVLQENHKVEMKCATLEEECEFVRNEYKKLEQKHKTELLEKSKIEYQLRKCKAQLEDMKGEQTVTMVRYERLLEEAKNRKKEVHKEVIFDPPREGNDLESENMKHKEMASQLHRLLNAKSLGLDNRSKKDSAHVIGLEYLTFDSMLAGDSNPQNGALRSSGTSRVEAIILLSDSDDDCAPREKDPKVLKRKTTASQSTTYNVNGSVSFKQNNTETGEMKQLRKFIRCSSVVNHVSQPIVSSDIIDYGKQENPSSAEVILRPFNKKIKETQKLPNDMMMAEDDDGLLSAVSAVAARAKALEGKSYG